MAASAWSRTLVTLLHLCILMFVVCAADEAEASVEDGPKPKKKSKFLASMPMIVKFSLFWWCIFVTLVMLGFIADRLAFRRYGGKRMYWSTERTFKAVTDREAYWVQFADPTRWSANHPVLQSADIGMVEGPLTLDEDGADGEKEPKTLLGFDVSSEGNGEGEGAEPSAPSSAASDKFSKVPLGPLAEGLGMRLWHKPGAGRLAGQLYCTRMCTQVQKPDGGAWRLCMKTVEVGPGHICLPGTEVIEVELSAPDKDGNMHCAMQGVADIGSRFYLWWKDLGSRMKAGGEAMLDAVSLEAKGSSRRE